ncbi:MAG: hypothetical protein AUH41_11835 [Gemmatimonadetes bacterium 13_1_40CM_66_11]|nr:MAG: hypothetical protein AUH41_11835 [Gemmatimonadetes bacterium 13_1_40CM_66_11]
MSVGVFRSSTSSFLEATPDRVGGGVRSIEHHTEDSAHALEDSEQQRPPARGGGNEIHLLLGLTLRLQCIRGGIGFWSSASTGILTFSHTRILLQNDLGDRKYDRQSR